jgi:hypothetical protein
VDGWWSLGVGLHLGGDVGWFIWVVLSRSSSSSEHGGCQMLGSNNQRLFDPNTRGNTRRWNTIAQENDGGEGLESTMKL